MTQIPLEHIRFAEDDDGLVNPRGSIVDTTDLQASMSLLGQQQAVTVYAVGRRYVVIDGHRRITAARILGWEVIEAEIQERPAEDELLVKMLASNVRVNFTPTQQGAAIRKLAVTRKWGIERVATACGLDVEDAHLMVDLLDAPEPLRRRVDKGEIALSTWKEIRNKPKSVQEEVAGMEKPTRAAVRQLTKKKDSAGVLSDMLDELGADNDLLTAVAALKPKLMGGWHALSPVEQIRVATLIGDLNGFIQEQMEAANGTTA
jgi:ParB/RepB/Spo0J family partition protein